MRHIFYVDVGNLPPGKALDAISQVSKAFAAKQFWGEDKVVYIAKRDAGGSEVVTLPGSDTPVNEVVDLVPREPKERRYVVYVPVPSNLPEDVKESIVATEKAKFDEINFFGDHKVIYLSSSIHGSVSVETLP